MDETYSSIGPECPHCGREFVADESWWYEQNNFEDGLECDECGETFDVEVSIETTWTCRERPPKAGAGER